MASCLDCASDCNDTCVSGCAWDCYTSCTGGCKGYCGSTCSGSCSGNCGDACTGCSGTCLDGCGNNCGTLCSFDCSDACSGCGGTCSYSCSTTCSGSCTGSCSGSCLNSCTGGCSSTCSGGCNKTCTSTENVTTAANIKERYNTLNRGTYILNSDINDIGTLLWQGLINSGQSAGYTQINVASGSLIFSQTWEDALKQEQLLLSIENSSANGLITSNYWTYLAAPLLSLYPTKSEALVVGQLTSAYFNNYNISGSVSGYTQWKTGGALGPGWPCTTSVYLTNYFPPTTFHLALYFVFVPSTSRVSARTSGSGVLYYQYEGETKKSTVIYLSTTFNRSRITGSSAIFTLTRSITLDSTKNLINLSFQGTSMKVTTSIGKLSNYYAQNWSLYGLVDV